MTIMWLMIAALVVLLGMALLWQHVVVRTGTVGLVYHDGVFAGQIQPGRHRLFDPLRRRHVEVVPLIAMPSMNYALSLMTRDQFAFRAQVSAVFRVTDPRAYHEARPIRGPQMIRMLPSMPETERLQPELASAMLGWAAGRSLEEIIAAPLDGLDALGPGIESQLAGITIEKLLLTDLTVPPEVRKMFTEVERARREGLAQLERARSEQASLRALANAARTLQSNPQLAQLRLLQTVEAAKGNKTFVLGAPGIDAIATSTGSE
jgi:regulator of protease activity HflC (stomatin/prohibitin superfamily)